MLRDPLPIPHRIRLPLAQAVGGGNAHRSAVRAQASRTRLRQCGQVLLGDSEVGMTTSNTSCIGCKYLYKQDRGYSNYTVEETEVLCALNLNPSLPASEPFDWEFDLGIAVDADNWGATKSGRCERYSAGPMVVLDVDGELSVEEQTGDLEQRLAICSHSGAEK